MILTKLVKVGDDIEILFCITQAICNSIFPLDKWIIWSRRRCARIERSNAPDEVEDKRVEDRAAGGGDGDSDGDDKMGDEGAAPVLGFSSAFFSAPS